MPSKFFKVCTEGPTIDGRQVTAEMILQAAESYNPKRYGARTNIEHWHGLVPGTALACTGDVVELKTEKNDVGKQVLLASLEPTERMHTLAKGREKIYWSAEFYKDPETLKWGLGGLAHTDQPATFGTEALKLSAAEHPPAYGMERPFIGEKMENDLHPGDFNTAPAPTEAPDTGWIDKMRELFSAGQRPEVSSSTDETIRAGFLTLSEQLAEQMRGLAKTEEVQRLTAQMTGMGTRLAALEKLSQTPDPQQTPPPESLGGASLGQTDF